MPAEKLGEIWGHLATFVSQSDALHASIGALGFKLRSDPFEIPVPPPWITAGYKHKLDQGGFREALTTGGVIEALEEKGFWRPGPGSLDWLEGGFGFGDLSWLYDRFAVSAAAERLEAFRNSVKRLMSASNLLRKAAEEIRWSLGLTGCSPIVSSRMTDELWEASETLAPSQRRIAELIKSGTPDNWIAGYADTLEGVASIIRRGRGRPAKARQKEFAREWAKLAKKKTGHCLDEAGLGLYSIIFEERPDLGDYVKLREKRKPKKR